MIFTLLIVTSMALILLGIVSFLIFSSIVGGTLLFFLTVVLPLGTIYFLYTAYQELNFFQSKRDQGVLYLGNGWVNFFTLFFWKKLTLHEVFQTQYNKVARYPPLCTPTVGGWKENGTTVYMLTDVEMFKPILVKDFDHFVNRRSVMPTKEKIFDKMVVFMQNENWKALRARMSPTFTTGKIKRMFSLFNKSGDKFVKYLDKKVEKQGPYGIDLWEAYSKYTMDIIATVVCGMDSKAFDQEEPSIFEEMGKKFQFKLRPKDMFLFAVLMTFPKALEKIGVFGPFAEAFKFFEKGIKRCIKHREETGEKWDDFLQIMLDERKKRGTEEATSIPNGAIRDSSEESQASSSEVSLSPENSEDSSESSSSVTPPPEDLDILLDDDTIVANCVLFILAGYDSTQSLLLFCSYALALNPEVQEKVRQEIDEVMGMEEEFTYDVLNDMPYLDMVINETLRFYPPALMLDRMCTRDYTIPPSPNTGGKPLEVKKGDGITIPIKEIHHDPRYYEDPEKFDPERFSPERKGSINPYAYLPFGQGPRNCIGMRFAITEVKLAVALLVRNFAIQPSKRTLIPMEYQNNPTLKPKHMWLSLKRIRGESGTHSEQ